MIYLTNSEGRNTYATYTLPQSIQDVLKEHGIHNKISASVHPALSLLNAIMANYNEKTPQITMCYRHYIRNDRPESIAAYIRNFTSDIIYIERTAYSGKAIAETIEQLKTHITDPIEELTNISLFLQEKGSPVRVYKRTNQNTPPQYYILTNKCTEKIMNTTIGLIHNWFPHIYTDLDEPRQNTIKNYLKAIGESYEDAAQEELTALLNLLKEPELPQINYSAIAALAQTNKQEKIRNLESDMRNAQDELRRITAELNRVLEKIEKIEFKQRMTLLEPDDSPTKELVKELQAFKSIKYYGPLEGVNSYTNFITIVSKMMPSDQDLAQKIFSDEAKAAFYGVHSQKFRQLMLDILTTDKYTINFRTSFRLANLTDSTITTENAIPQLKKNTVPNPHLTYYNCFGGNAATLAHAGRKKDVITYLGVLTASNSNLNIGDATVLKLFCSHLLSTLYDKQVLFDNQTQTYIAPRQAEELIGG